MKRVLFLVENTESLTVINLIQAFKQQAVDVIPYFRNKQKQCSMIDTVMGTALLFDGKYYYPHDYDAALLWCWGTANIGSQYLRLFEDQGVEVLNSTYHTEVTDSKIGIVQLLQHADIPTPKTLCFSNDTPIPPLNDIELALGQAPYILKADYGTQGRGIEFLFSIHEVQEAIVQRCRNGQVQSGFILQEFIGDPQQPIFHYRILVIGDQIIPTGMKVSAIQPMHVSNVSADGLIEWVAVDEEIENMALQAAQASGLNVAGVDIMMSTQKQQRKAVVLEVNDGPGTKTFDKQGINASQAIVDYFLHVINSGLSFKSY